MSRTFFDQVLVSPPRRGSPRWLRFVSVAVHLTIAILVLFGTITALELPAVHARLPVVLLATAAAPPVPPAPPTPRVVTQAEPIPATGVPLAPPEGIHPAPDRPASIASLGVPGGIDAGVPAMGATPLATGPLPPPPAQRPVPPRRVGGDILPPRRTVFVAPVYPPAARAARVEGTVVIDAVIDVNGLVRDVTVLTSIPLLDRAALEAVQQWRYTPTRLNGEAIAVRMTVSVRFSLK